MKRKLLFYCLPLLAIAVYSCGPSLKVTSDYDKGANFTKYKTFSIYKSDTINDAISQLNQNRIINAIKNEMVKKGFRENTTSPDLLVNTVAILKDRVSVSSTTNVYGYGGFYRPYSWGGGGAMYGNTNYDVQHYKDGSLIIDLIDAGSKQLVWQGIGNSEIDKPLKNPDTDIPKAITSIMAGFPPGMSSK